MDESSIPRPPSSELIPAVFAAILNDRAELLLLHRMDLDMWCLPGGLLEVGESLRAGLVRECREELSVEVEPGRLVGVYSEPERHLFRFRNGDVRHYLTTVLAAAIRTGEPRPCGVEADGLGWFGSGALPRIVPSHGIWIGDSFGGETWPCVR